MDIMGNKRKTAEICAALCEKCMRDVLGNYYIIACALIKRYFDLQPQLLDYEVTRFLYDEACDILKKEEPYSVDVSDVGIGECTPCVAFCLDLLQKYRKMDAL